LQSPRKRREVAGEIKIPHFPRLGTCGLDPWTWTNDYFVKRKHAEGKLAFLFVALRRLVELPSSF